MIYFEENNPNIINGVIGDNLKKLLDVNSKNLNSNPSFYYVMKSKYYRDIFLTIICDLLNTSFKEDNIIEIVDKEHNKIIKENNIFYSNEQNIAAMNSIELMKKSNFKRRKDIMQDIDCFFELRDKYDLI